tara:strand:- start:2824 stop:3378 length:555 start_codon:yes stop_codon:yes gene_type:complete
MVFSGDYEIDNMLMTDILDNIEFYSGSTRRKMLKRGNIKHPKDGGSMLYGKTWRGYLKPGVQRVKDPFSNMFLTKIKAENPILQDIFEEFADFHFPHFDFGSIQMNKNFQCPKHLDSSNTSKSILCTFGNFTGGNTIVDMEDEIISLDGRKSPVSFDGGKYYHWVEDFIGTRYSLVFFHNKCSK